MHNERLLVKRSNSVVESVAAREEYTVRPTENVAHERSSFKVLHTKHVDGRESKVTTRHTCVERRGFIVGMTRYTQ